MSDSRNRAAGGTPFGDRRGDGHRLGVGLGRVPIQVAVQVDRFEIKLATGRIGDHQLVEPSDFGRARPLLEQGLDNLPQLGHPVAAGIRAAGICSVTA